MKTAKQISSSFTGTVCIIQYQLSKLKLTILHIEKSIPILKAIRGDEKKQLSEALKNKDQKIEQEQVAFAEKNEDNLKNEKQFAIGEEKTLKYKLADASGVITEREFDKMISTSINEEGIFVANAGLVLLHPFLHSLFTRLDLTNEEKFIDKSLHQKTLYILHYLATGKVETEEHELVIGKILSDHPLEEGVGKNIEISKEILQEADEMIIAAIQQWDKLTGTYAVGLREGFLQRKSNLSSRNGNLYLQVEQSAIDILLDYLPWNLSMIKLPLDERYIKSGMEIKKVNSML